MLYEQFSKCERRRAADCKTFNFPVCSALVQVVTRLAPGARGRFRVVSSCAGPFLVKCTCMCCIQAPVETGACAKHDISASLITTCVFLIDPSCPSDSERLASNDHTPH